MVRYYAAIACSKLPISQKTCNAFYSLIEHIQTDTLFNALEDCINDISITDAHLMTSKITQIYFISSEMVQNEFINIL